MIKANLLRKKNAIIAFLLAFCFSLGMSAFAKTLVKAAEAGVDEEPTENIVLDMNLTDAWFEVNGTKITNNTVDNNPALNLFGGDGTSQITWTETIAKEETVVVKFGKSYKAEYFSSVDIKLAVGGVGEKVLNGYALTDSAFENSAGTVTATAENENAVLSLDVSQLAGEDGSISGFVIKKTDGVAGQIFADYVKLVLKVEEEKAPTENAVFDMDGAESWIEVDGVKVTNIHPDNVFHTLGNPNVFPKAEGKTKIMFTENIGNQALIVVKLGKKVKAKYFEKIKINLCVGNNKNGAPAYSNAITVTGYAVADKAFATPAGKIKTGGGEVTKLLSLNPETLKDADGYIESFVLRKTETDTECVGQIFVDYVEFCLVGSEPKPVVSEEFITKDISEVMPVESGVTFGVVTTEQTVNTTTVNAAVKAAAFDKLTLKITPDSESKFSTYVLLKAPTASATYEDGGIFFWISNDSIVIGNKDVNENLLAAEFPANAFVSGKATEIAIAAIPYYINGENAGYYCALYLAGETNPLVEVYLGIEDVTAGVYTNILTQDLGNDYTVTYGSALSEPVKAKDLMNVKVVTRSGKDTFDTPRAALELTYFEVAGNVVGDLVIEGDATYESGFLTFQKAGTVKVKYTVTNAFGTFESNELTLTYVDGSSTTDETENCSGCNGSAGSAGLIGLVILSIAAVATVRRKK